nr:uncharacterized protein LOC129269815 [Lytechinus pictus]
MSDLSGSESEYDPAHLSSDQDSPWSNSESEQEEEFARENQEEAGPDIPAGMQAAGILPYQFEPEFQPGEEIQNVGAIQENDIEGRLGNNNWCLCSGGCQAMPRVVESYCCKEVAQVVAMMDQYTAAELNCITEHPGFEGVCLNPWVLDTAYLGYRQQYGDRARHDATENEKHRHVGYRQLARWCWGFLGRSVRVPLPSCAVTRIRATYPSDIYRGFEDA